MRRIGDMHGRAETSAAEGSASACPAGMEAAWATAAFGDGLPERRLDFGQREHAERVAPQSQASRPSGPLPGHALHRSAMPCHAVQSRAVEHSLVIVLRKRRAIVHASMHAAPGRWFNRRADARILLHVQCVLLHVQCVLLHVACKAP